MVQLANTIHSMQHVLSVGLQCFQDSGRKTKRARKCDVMDDGGKAPNPPYDLGLSDPQSSSKAVPSRQESRCSHVART